MRTQRSRFFVVVTLLIVCVVAVAATAQAIREHSWGPILSVAWLPAVLAVTVRQPEQTHACRRWLHDRWRP